MRKFHKKPVPCPFCTNRHVTYVPDYVTCEASAEEDILSGFIPHVFVECRKCHNQIGIMITGVYLSKDRKTA